MISLSYSNVFPIRRERCEWNWLLESDVVKNGPLSDVYEDGFAVYSWSDPPCEKNYTSHISTRSSMKHGKPHSPSSIDNRI